MESNPFKKYEAPFPSSPEVDYPLEQTIIRRLVSKGGKLFAKIEEEPMTPVTDIDEYRQRRREERWKTP